jgi:hypothetical protein
MGARGNGGREPFGRHRAGRLDAYGELPQRIRGGPPRRRVGLHSRRPPGPRPLVLAAALIGALLLAGCKLTEVTVAPGTQMVVVQSVLSRSTASQYVVLEYSLAGDSVPGPTGDSVPPDSPKFPISGATVTIAHQNGPCAGRVDTLAEQPPATPGASASGIYSGSVCPSAPGDTLALQVTTPSGEVVTGARDVRLAGGASALPGDTLLLDRTRDTIKIGITAIAGRGIQVEARPTISYQGGRNPLYAITDTLGMALPGNLVNPFEGDSGRTIFRAGRYYTLAVALMDANYWDFTRSRTDPITGRGFINHLDGGIGVFGSVETTRYTLRVTAPQADPREGVYRITGTLDGTPVDIAFDLYIDEVEPRLFSGFADGQWVGGNLHATGDGFFNGAPSTSNSLLVYIPAGGADSTGAYALSGIRTDDRSPFSLAAELLGSTRMVTATLTAQQISGP